MQGGVEPRLRGLGEHSRRQVDALDPVGAAVERPRHQARAAAEIEDEPEAGRAQAQDGGAAQRVGDEFRAAVVQVAEEVPVEAGGVIVKERAKIGRGDRPLRWQGAKLGEVDADAEGILRLEGERPPERRHRLLRPPEAGRGAAEERVRGGKIRRPFEGLRGKSPPRRKNRPPRRRRGRIRSGGRPKGRRRSGRSKRAASRPIAGGGARCQRPSRLPCGSGPEPR